MTKGGIFLDIKESNYNVTKYGLIFYFSSKFYMEKFKENVEKYVQNETLKFKNRYKVNVNLNKIFAVSLYKKIEKRGYKVLEELTNKGTMPCFTCKISIY